MIRRYGSFKIYKSSAKRGGGDAPLRNNRIYRFTKRRSLLDWVRLRRFKVTKRFHLDPNIDDEVSTQRLLDQAPFEIDGVNVYKWFEEAIHNHARLQFEVRCNIEQILKKRPAEKILIASFSDPKDAMLFKLTFGTNDVEDS